MLRIIAGKYKGRRIITDKTFNARPTMALVRDAIFNIISHKKSLMGCKILDIFCGSGSFSFEALSRGAEHSFLVDTNHTNLNMIQKNAISINIANNITLINCSADNLPIAQDKCDIVFIDPPYFSELVEKTLQSVLRSGWIDDQSIIIVEIHKRENFIIDENFEVLFTRFYGITKILFLSLKSSF